MNLIQNIRWRPEIGDPTAMGWITVGSYAAVALLAFLVAWRARVGDKNLKAQRTTWFFVAVLMAFLCINKQLDLQSLATDIGRVISYEFGWYEKRREFQKQLVITVLVVSFLTTTFLAIRYRKFLLRNLILASGLSMLLTFIVVRAVSFHHVDILLKTELAGARVNWILELGGIALIGSAALLSPLSQPSKADPTSSS